MKRTLLPALASLVIVCATRPATSLPAPPAPESTAFEARLNAELGVPGGLTADHVARRAVVTSFDVSARRAGLVAAAADVDRALLAYLPEVSVSASYLRLSDIGTSNLGTIVVAPDSPPGPLPPGATLANAPFVLEGILNQYVLQANLLVPVSDYFLRVAPAHASAKYAEQAASANVLVARAQTMTDAQVTYYGWVRARLAVTVAEQALRDAEAHLRDARVGEDAGTASHADVLRLESQVARSELLLISSRSLAALSEQQLRTALHDDSNEPLAVGEDIRIDPPPAPATAGAEGRILPTLWTQAERNRPELRALSANARAFGAQARAERASYLPRLELLAGATYANPNPRIFPPESEFRGTWQAGGRLSWALNDIPAARARAEAATARGAASIAERSALVDRVHIEVRAALQAVDDSDVALRTTRRGLAAAEESYRVRRLLFQNGRSTSVELLDAETELTRARLENLNTLVDARVTRARLKYALGLVAPSR